ncbi:MAG: hypothetical protein A3H57_01065 [Candidatus Taylorbacteria bacterium RIFCSPLOWO2_02_FULL_43_11]|nr:MAG: hypothetical protein A3H57_01065 [Candidatus Taylorbacteria bacterium RIFCSPLOWO2_02_FULL_43_11]
MLTLTGATIENVSGVALGPDVTRTWTVEAVNSDTVPPSIMFANGDDFSLAITWNEAINGTDAINLSNYTLTVGETAQALSGMAGHQLTFDASTRTVKLTGLRLTSGSSFSITASNIKDTSGNIMTTPSTFSGTIQSYANSGGFVGPGSYEGTTFGEFKDFSASGIGFMPPVNIMPQNTFVSASSTYQFELPIASQIPANGSIVITFPSSADFGICCAATTSANNPFISSQNADINGPGTGVIGIKTITKDNSAKSITLTLDSATRSENSDTHDFLRFVLTDIKNPSIPKSFDSSGYSIDIKSKNASGVLLESFTANPVFIGGGGAGGGATTTIRGIVSGNGGVLVGATIHLMSMQTGPMDATTDVGGVYEFTNIPVGTQMLQNNFGGGSEFMLFTDPFISGINDANGATTTSFYGSPMPTPVMATSTSIVGRNFSLTSTGSGSNFTVKITAAADTFTSTEQLDVFAGGPGQFLAKTVTPGASALDAATLTTIPIPQTNGIWNVGIGPAMPKGGNMSMSSPPPAPTWSMPKPIEVTVSGCPSACAMSVNGTTATSYTFTISVADKTISGILKDGSGNAISSAGVYAFSPSLGIGNHSQTSASGSFSIRVVSGSYNVGSFSPGIGQSKEVPVVIDSSGNVYVDGSPTASTGTSGANPFILKMAKPAYTITGRVTDGTNAIGNAPVYGYRTDGPGHVDAMTDSSTGNYTLYVDSGTWKIGSFISGFGPATEQTVTITTSNRADINFSPASGQTFSILSGNLYEDTDESNSFTSTEGISGAVIRVSGASGSNEGISGNDGAYSIRVPSGTGYQITDVFKPNYGKIAALQDNGSAIGTINLTASTTKNIKIPIRSTVTVNIKDSDGNKTIVPKAFIDFFDNTTGTNNHTEITNASSTTITVPKGTTPSVRVFIQGVPPQNISVASDDAGTDVSAGVVTADGSTEVIKIVINTATASLSTISGTVYQTAATGGNELEGAWIQFGDETNGVFFGTQATTSGRFSIKAANGTYQVMANKPGYIGTPASLTVSGDATENFVLVPASLTISGTVTSGGSPASDAFVRAEKVGGGQAVGQTDTSGTYTLYVTSGTWRVYASAEGYAEGAYSSNPITVTSSVSGITVALTSTVSLQTKLATSNTFSDTSVGSLSDSTLGVEVNLDANALGQSGSNSYLNAKETSNFPNTSSVSIIGNKAKEINAYAGSSKITNLQSGSKASLEFNYTKAELNSSSVTSTTTVGKLNIVAYSDDKKDWETLSTVQTYLDSDGAVVASPEADLSNVASVTFTALTTHFSTFALSSPTGVEPPSTPTGLSASAGSAGSGQITLSWDAVTGATGYYLYRDTSSTGSFALLADVGNVTSYANSGLSNGTAYYYKVSAYKSGGSSESAASSAASATISTVAAVAVGGGPLGGGGGGVSIGTPTPQSFVSAIATTDGGVSLTKTNDDGTSATVLIPSGILSENATFKIQTNATAPLNIPSGKTLVGSSYEITATIVSSNSTTSAVTSFSSPIRVQLRYSDDQLTNLNESSLAVFTLQNGTTTWKKLGSTLDTINNVVTATTTHLSQFAILGSPSGTVVTPTPVSKGQTQVEARREANRIIFTRTLSVGSSGLDVAALQTFLESKQYLKMPPGVAKGYFGAITKVALMKYQKDAGFEQVGILGPKTRAKIEAESGGDTETSKPVSQSPSGTKLTKMLIRGMVGSDVILLQQLLNKDPETVVAETGDGSPGMETNFFGEKTLESVQKFQEKHGIASPDDEGYGIVGPKTRAKLNQI